MFVKILPYFFLKTPKRVIYEYIKVQRNFFSDRKSKDKKIVRVCEKTFINQMRRGFGHKKYRKFEHIIFN